MTTGILVLSVSVVRTIVGPYNYCVAFYCEYSRLDPIFAIQIRSELELCSELAKSLGLVCESHFASHPSRPQASVHTPIFNDERQRLFIPTQTTWLVILILRSQVPCRAAVLWELKQLYPENRIHPGAYGHVLITGTATLDILTIGTVLRV